jgi:hypothetical protein
LIFDIFSFLFSFQFGLSISANVKSHSSRPKTRQGWFADPRRAAGAEQMLQRHSRWEQRQGLSADDFARFGWIRENRARAFRLCERELESGESSGQGELERTREFQFESRRAPRSRCFIQIFCSGRCERTPPIRKAFY